MFHGFFRKNLGSNNLTAPNYLVWKRETYTPGKYKRLIRPRSVYCYWAVRELGEKATSLAKRLGLTQPGISKSVLIFKSIRTRFADVSRRRLLHQISSLTNRTNVLHYGGRIFSKEIDRVGTCPCYCANSRSKSPAFLGEDSLPGLFYSAYREIIPINGFRRILCPFENIFCNIGNHFLDIRCQIGSLQISTV